MSSVLILIQARMQSHRFPGKVLAYLKGKPLIDRIVAAVPTEYPVVVATGRYDDNIPLIRHLMPGPACIAARGLEESDVLGRFAAIAVHPEFVGDDVIVRLTADCALHSTDVIRRTVEAFDPSMGYLFSHWLWPLPKGQEVEVFTRQMLLDAHQNAADPYDREHVTPWMRRKVGDRPALYTGENLCVDTVEDLHRLEAMPWHT